MKKISFLIFYALCNYCYAQNCGINPTGTMPKASAGLDIDFTNKGLLIPRVALRATNSAIPIASPATSLLVYNTATDGISPNNVVPGFYYWDGSKWVSFRGIVGGTGVTGATGFAGGTGTIGVTGGTGSQGIQGVDGTIGATGLQGTIGEPGAIGATGFQGFTGATGEAGFQGIQGVTGAVGITGETGLTGATGADGSLNAWSLTGNAGTTTGTNFIGTTDPNDFVLKTNNTEKIRVASNGNIGIGTSSPNTKLQIYGNSGNLLKLQTSNIMSNAGESMGITFATSWGDEVSRIESITESNGNIGLRFYSYKGQLGGLAERVRISSGGNFGIGTSSPTEKIDVVGNIKFSGAIMPNNTAGTSGQVLTSAGAGIAPTWTTPGSGYLTSEVDGSVTNEIQTLSIHNDTLTLSNNGGSVKLPSLSTGPVLPSVITVDVTEISYINVLVNATITNNGNEFILTRGVCISRNSMPDLNDTVYLSGIGSGSFITNCNQLAPYTIYHIRAFATNTAGTAYGNELSFTTKVLTVPILTTQVIANITNTTALSGGNITDDGGIPILERGICWSLSSNPTTADNFVTEGLGGGSYIALMTGLISNTLYHVRAYATNAQGTSYGNDLSFTTIVLQFPSLTTTSPGSISYTTATCGGNVSNDNGSSVTSRGICWATTTSPTTANSNYSETGGLGSFTAGMTGLTANSTYYVRAFAINGGGTSYGNQVSFSTLTPAVASLTTKTISGISSNLAGSGGVISNDGGSAITAKGVCWSLNPTPTIANSKTTDGTGTASYNSTMAGLNLLTLYYVRAYATNGLGTAYGNEISFTTTDLVTQGPTVPVVGTSVSSITGSSTASSGGYVSSDGGSSVTARGVCWSTSTNPTLADNFSTDGGTGMGYFTSTITGLSGCGTVYNVRAYATNSTGTGYGNQNTVSTGLLPVVTTDDASSISYYSAVSGGSITTDGGCPITQKGICWSYNPSPTISNSKTTEGAGNAAFVSNITGLNANRTYYVRAYATNSVGTIYGIEKVFTTATPSTPYVGQNYAGGVIFYLDSTGLHGLVCASVDQGDRVAWGCQGTSIPTGSAIGTGAVNTAAIVASCGEANIAAKICDDLVLNSYSDWFLPSIDELAVMYTNLKAQDLGGLGNYYWSSSESDNVYAWFYYFSLGAQYQTNKDNAMSVRAVRAF